MTKNILLLGLLSCSFATNAIAQDECCKEKKSDKTECTVPKTEKPSALSRFSIGGYGEAVMSRNFYSQHFNRYRDPATYKNDDSHGRFDLPHVTLNLGYDFGPVALNWYTNCLGAVGCTPEGAKAYASYFEVSAPFSLGGIDWSAAVGATPWANDYYGAEGFAVICASLTATKEIALGSDFSIPVFASLMANPRSEQLFFSVGVSF